MIRLLDNLWLLLISPRSVLGIGRYRYIGIIHPKKKSPLNQEIRL